VAAAARDWGFFHLVNYHHVIHPPLFSSGYPVRALAAVRAFNESYRAPTAPSTTAAPR
jgi:hypothetical protein